MIVEAKALLVPEGMGPRVQAELRWALSWFTHRRRKGGRGFEEQWVDLVIVGVQTSFCRAATPSDEVKRKV